MALEQKYVGYDAYTPEQHRQQIEANQQAVAQTKSYFVEFYQQQVEEEQKRQDEFNQRMAEALPKPEPTTEEMLKEMTNVLKKFEKFLDKGEQ